MGWISRALAWRLDPILMRLSGGRLRFGLLLPTALLETRGARTGALRRNGVIYFHDGDRVVIVASKLGLPQHPAWFHNVRSIRSSDWAGDRSARRSSPMTRSGPGSGTSRIASFRRMPPTAFVPPPLVGLSRSSASTRVANWF